MVELSEVFLSKLGEVSSISMVEISIFFFELFSFKTISVMSHYPFKLREVGMTSWSVLSLNKLKELRQDNFKSLRIVEAHEATLVEEHRMDIREVHKASCIC